MSALGRQATPWAVLWRSENARDGKCEHLMGTTSHPCRCLVFETRAEARKFIADKYGYIKDRRDLRSEPHGWKMPVPVRVNISVERA